MAQSKKSMIGTITNTCTIILGSTLGAILKKGIRPEWQKVLFTAMGLASLALGFNAVCQNMPKSEYPVLFILSLSIGGLIGTVLDLDGRFKRLVDKISKDSNNSKDLNNSKDSKDFEDFEELEDPKEFETAKDSKPDLATGLATGVLLFCIGTLSIVGPINSALLGDNTFLFTNATLDFVTSAVLAATYGIGMVLAAPILFCWQGSIWLIARLCGNVIPDEMLCEMQIVGGVLIVASGLAMLNIKDCKTLNLLPSLAVPVVYFLLIG